MTADTAVTAATERSLPEMVILRKVLRPRLIAAFVAIVASGIPAVGHLFDVIL